MQRLMFALDFLFGCHHRHLSRVFTIEGRTYRVCCDCGAKFVYSLSSMSIERRARRFDVPQGAQRLPQKCYITARLHRYTRTTAFRDADSAPILQD